MRYLLTNTLLQAFCILSIITLISCNPEKASEINKTDAPEKKDQKKYVPSGAAFRILDSNHTGIKFINSIKEDKVKNYFNYEYIYNGAGVAVGDINNDSLPDIFFSGNQVQNKLYLNQGEMRFSDISAAANIEGNGAWNTGVTMVDINSDGLLDIYVCKSGWPNISSDQRKNLLYINQGNSTFLELAEEYGLDESGYSIQSSFFDFDNDGDLDVYISNHPYAFNLGLEERLAIRKNPPEDVRDKLYINNGNNNFSEISRAAGIVNYGHGLGLVTSDINKDGYVDIYVGNDYKEPDYLYINNGDGTFSNKINDYMAHIAFNAMGVDIADINNDQEEDIFITEMLPFEYKRSKTNMAAMNVKLFEGMVKLGLHHQYMHNVLQLNSGPVSSRSDKRRFSDVSQIAGISKTDWSWSCLLSDFDNDGLRDVFIANGNKRDIFDKDYPTRANALAKQRGGQLSLDELYEVMPSTKVANQIFKNKDGLNFESKTEEWGFDVDMLSQGGAVGDFDNDGDLDIVVNNLDEPSVIFENVHSKKNGNFLKVRLKGPQGNSYGLNAKIRLYSSLGVQYFEAKTTRGYQSSSEAIFHFGLNKIEQIEKISVQWLDGTETIIEKIKTNQTIEIAHDKAKPTSRLKRDTQSLLKDNSKLISPVFQHKENIFDDYKVQVLLPHRQSQNGPFISKGDISGDGLEDFFVGGAHNQSGAVYIQKRNGEFSLSKQAAIEKDQMFEDLGSILFDCDGDNDLDLMVISGGAEFVAKSPLYRPRLYRNDGKGNLSRDLDALPQLNSSCQSVSSSDFDNDGDIDLFVGGRIFPDHYPYATPSYLLENDGKGNFRDIARTQNQGLNLAGMVTSSVWSDIDGDNDEDLILVGEWMPITIFRNDKGLLVNVTNNYNLQNTTGWWNKIVKTDYDGDGDEDYILGNLGLNHKFNASPEKPFHIYCGDYDNNGTYDIVLAKNYNDQLVPIRGRQCSSEQMPFIAEKFETYQEFANMDIKGLIGDQLDDKLHYEAKMFESVIMEKTENGFSLIPLPAAVQISTINGIVPDDLNGDGIVDLILGGNMYHTEAETSRADASIGSVLLGQKNKSFKVLSASESGLFIPGDVKDIQKLKGSKGNVFIVANNNDKLEVFK